MRSGISRVWGQYPGPEGASPKIRSSGSLVLTEGGLSFRQGSEQSIEVVNIDVLVDDQRIPFVINIIERNGSVMTNRPKRVAKDIRDRYGARFGMLYV